jgi:hypothetical protein
MRHRLGDVTGPDDDEFPDGSANLDIQLDLHVSDLQRPDSVASAAVVESRRELLGHGSITGRIAQ